MVTNHATLAAANSAVAPAVGVVVLLTYDKGAAKSAAIPATSREALRAEGEWVQRPPSPAVAARQRCRATLTREAAPQAPLPCRISSRVSQSPAAGSKLAEGGKVTIRLE